MRILYLCHKIPYPPDKGEKIRAYHQIAQLARRHEVHLVSFGENPHDPANEDGLRRICASVAIVPLSRPAGLLAALGALATGFPLSIAVYESGALRRAVSARFRASPPDAVVVYTAAMAPYAAPLRVPRLLDFVDVDSEKWRVYGELMRPPLSLLYAMEGKRLAAYEARIARDFDECLLISAAEARLLEARAPGVRVGVIANGVDLDYFRPAGGDGGAPPAPRRRAVFVGMMDYYPNCDAVEFFAREVLPLVRREIPDFEFQIVGRRPTAAVPVVGTRLAFQAIDAGEDDGIRKADDPAAFAGLVLELARTPSLRGERGAASRRYVERHHRWEAAGAALEGALVRLVEGARSTGAAPSGAVRT